VIEMLIAVYKVDGLVIVVVVGVFMMVDDISKRSDTFKEYRWVVALRNKQFRYAAASQPEIVENIVSKPPEVIRTFGSGQHGHAVAVFADDMRLVPEIVGEIA